MKRIVAGDVILPSVAVAGYPRELEAIILTAMANDPNARFQTAQEMTEALDAFAVRMKLTGSNTAMGRFMAQLFGSKKEPWIDHANDRTQISTDAPEHDETDNEKTIVVDDRDRERATTSNDGDTERDRAVTSNEHTPRPMAMAMQHAPMPLPAPGRTPAPGLPFETRTPSNPASIPVELARLGSEPLSEPGAKPLIDDKLGWTTGIQPLQQYHNGSGARLETNVPSDYRIKSKNGWIILVVLMILGLAAGVGIAVRVEGDTTSSSP
jgi:hypothetical protein